VIDATTGATIATITTTVNDNATSGGLAISPDGKRVYALNTGQPAGTDAITVIDTATNSVIATISTPPATFNSYAAAFSPDGARAYVSQTRFETSGTDPLLTVIDVASSAVIDTVVLGHTFLGGATARGVAISPDGKRVYVVNETDETSQVSIVDTATDGIITTIPIAAGASTGISITPDGAKLYVPDYGANSVTVVDTATNATEAVVPVGKFRSATGSSSSRYQGSLGYLGRRTALVRASQRSRGNITASMPRPRR
jgi:YVTN family beta-propeller protein